MTEVEKTKDALTDNVSIAGIVAGAQEDRNGRLVTCRATDRPNKINPFRRSDDDPTIRLCKVGTQYALDLPSVEILSTLASNGIALFGLFVFAGMLCFALWLIVMRVLRALAGFSVPLGSPKLPRLFLGGLWGAPLPPGCMALNRKSLLVNAPWILFPMLYKGGVAKRIVLLNVAESQRWSMTLDHDTILIVTGLELVIADRTRRLTALTLLEKACRQLAVLGATTTARMIILAESAPLERILDAFERDHTRPKFDDERENFRWSRLFEDFATHIFEQPQMTRLLDPDDLPNVDADTRSVVNTVLEECRWLPPRIINGGIGQEILLGDQVLESAMIPVEEAVYPNKYNQPLIKWALEREFPGPNAVRSYFRSQFIEYYQRIWLSSTDAEHLVMHNMAHHRFVNIGTALAFSSLVRRGVVVLDPEPHLMNKSFAMFVRQVEKLDTIQEWKRLSPQGAWATARLPLFAVIGVGLAVIIAMVFLSEEEPAALLPVLAAGIPALVAAVRRIMRPLT